MPNGWLTIYILLIARIFPRPFRARKNTTQLSKDPRVLYVKHRKRCVNPCSVTIGNLYHSFKVLVQLRKGIWEKNVRKENEMKNLNTF